MKSLTVFSFAILALTIGCDNAPAQNNGYGNHQISQAVPVNQNKNNGGNQSADQQGGYTKAPQSQNNGNDEITMHPVINSKTGQPSMYIPFPVSWKFIEGAKVGEPAMRGPNGLVVTFYTPQSYTYTNDPSMNQSLQSNGVQVIAPVGIEAVMTQQIIPQGQQMGMTLLNQYPLPGIASCDAAYANKLSGRTAQDIYQSIGSDWTDQAGNKVLVVLHYYEMRSSGSIGWGYNVELLKVQPATFEQAKNQFIFGMSNKVYNQSEINAFNSQLAAKLKADNDNFQAIQKINSDGARERAKINADANAYIQNSQIESYEYRQHNNDQLQQQTVNALTDKAVVVSPYDGKEYQVESGSTTYWINDQGKYIQSDDPLYDPNKYETHPGVWQQAPTKVYK